jgi:membrane-bound ClpP family serine protease
MRYLIVLLGCFFTPFLSAFEETPFAETIRFHSDGINKVGYLSMPRDRAIDQSTYLQVKFALEEYRKEQVCFILLHLNTPGGEVFAATSIAELLQEIDQKDHIPVIAVIDNWALSAGAMLAYSCRFIVVSNQALMGAAEPVMASSSGQMESAPEKMNSALRAEFGALAKRYGRNPFIAEAMVDKDILLVKRDGEIMRLNEMSSVQQGDEIISAQGKLLTLDADELLALHSADFRLPPSGNLFELPFFASIPQVKELHYESWKIDFFSFLTHPLVASLLMMGLILGVYMEMQHPGMGVPGIVALICLGLVLLSHFSTQAVDWLEIVFVFVGILLLLIEVFILPGFGVTGILGVLFILFGVGALLLPSWESTQFSWSGEGWNLSAIAFMNRLEWLLGSLLLSSLIILLIAKFLTPRVLARNKMISQETQEGSVAGLEKDQLPLKGAEGRALTPLHPGGKIQIGDQIYDALSEGELIDRGAKVFVSKIQGCVIFVTKG